MNVCVIPLKLLGLNIEGVGNSGTAKVANKDNNQEGFHE